MLVCIVCALAIAAPDQSSVLRRAPAIQIRPILAPALAVHRTKRLNTRRLIARVGQQQRDYTVRRYACGGEIPDRGPVVGVRPQVLQPTNGPSTREDRREGRRTRTKYCRPARIQGDSVRLKNMSAGSLSVLSCPPHTDCQYTVCPGKVRRTHQHEDRSILARPTPILRRKGTVAGPVRLHIPVTSASSTSETQQEGAR